MLPVHLGGFWRLLGKHVFNFDFIELSTPWSSTLTIRVSRLCLLCDKFDMTSRYTDKTVTASQIDGNSVTTKMDSSPYAGYLSER